MKKHDSCTDWLHNFYVKDGDGKPEELSLNDERHVRKIMLFVEHVAARMMRGQDPREELVSLTLLELGSKYRNDKNATVSLPYIRTIMGGFKGKVIYNQKNCHLSDARSLSSVTLQAAKKVRAAERQYEYEYGRSMGWREREALVERVRGSFTGKVKPRVGFADCAPLSGFEGEYGNVVVGASGVASMVKGHGLVGKIGLELVSDSVFVGAIVNWLLDGQVEELARQARFFLDNDNVEIVQLPLVMQLVGIFTESSVRIVDVCEVFSRPEVARILLEDIAQVRGGSSVQEMLF